MARDRPDNTGGSGGDGGSSSSSGGDRDGGGREPRVPDVDRLREREPDVAGDDRGGGGRGVITPTSRTPRSDFDVPDRRRRGPRARAGGSLGDRPRDEAGGSIGVESAPDRRDGATPRVPDVPAGLGATAPRVTPDDEFGNDLGGAAIDTAAGLEDRLAELPGAGAASSAAGGAASAASTAYYGVTDRVPFSEPLVEGSADLRDATVENVVEPGASGFEELAEPAEDVPFVGDELAALPRMTGAGVRRAGEAAAAWVPGAPATIAETVGAGERAVGFAGDQLGERGLVRGTEAIGATAAGATAAAASGEADRLQQRPVERTGELLGLAGATFTGSLAAGRAAGRLSRGLGDRVRTVGGERIDPEEFARRDVLEDVESGEASFPPADEPALYRTDPAEAVRRQSAREFPEELEETLDEATIDEGTNLAKGVEVDPEGPAPAGFRTLDETLEDADFAYETPGAFFAPELSPYFLGVGSRSAGISFRPGLPDLGPRPTAVAARTRVDTPDAGDLETFRREMIERRGETTARTKPASEVNPGEIEVVAPPAAEFVDVSTGPIRNVLRRAGIGADYYTEVGGRRVPIRTVADPDLVDEPGSRSLREFLEDDRAQAGARGGDTRVRRSFSRRDSADPVDRPLPLAGTSGSAPSSSSIRELERELDRSIASARSIVDESSGSPVTEGRDRALVEENPGVSSGDSGPSRGSRGSTGSSASSTGSSTGGASSTGGSAGSAGSSSTTTPPATSTPPSTPPTAPPFSGAGGTARPIRRDGESEDVEPLFTFAETGESWRSPVAQAEEIQEELEEDLEFLDDELDLEGGRA